MKIVINTCYGGFGLTNLVYSKLEADYYDLDNEAFGIQSDNYMAWRASPKLISVIEEVGVVQSGDTYAELKIIEIPDGVEWGIHEYDGLEYIYEVHRTWK